ncbi:hypothetical protein ACFLUO_08545 [Chloroflexota bacterium]
MKIYNSYILTVALALLLTTIALIAIGQNSLVIYYTFYIVEALIITELYAYLNTKARRGLSVISIMLLAGFVSVLCLQVIKIIT